MSQVKIEQFNEQDMALLEQLDEMLESAELELQKTATLLVLKTEPKEAFEGILSIVKKIEDIAIQVNQEDIRMIASEKLVLFTLKLNEVIDQTK